MRSQRLSIERVLIVHRKSLYQIYIEEHKERAVQQALRRRDPAALAIKQSHRTHAAAVASIQQTLDRRGIEVVCRWRAHERSTRNFDLVISLGGDGTLLDTARRVRGRTPLLGINSDPGRSVGALCSGGAEGLPSILDALTSGQLRPRRINRIRVRVDGEEVLGPVLNDVLFAHVCPAGLTRFDRAIVEAERALETLPTAVPSPFRPYRGSGIWVSTAIGSTAAIRSAGGRAMVPGSRRLQMLVREPYVPLGQPRPEGLHGYVGPGQALVLINRLRRGMLWADGPHRALAVHYGQQVVLDNHPDPLRLVRR